MPTEPYEVKTVDAQDGTKLEIRPLPIGRQKKFMERLSQDPTEGDDFGLDKLIDLVAICLAKKYPEKAQDREWLEENIDQDIAVDIVEAGGGIKLNDPNLIAQVVAATEAATEGTGTA